MKNGQQRRTKIIAMLSEATEPVNATAIAGELSVTRQIIVSDIALLRASGYKIRSLHRGYMLETESDDLIKKHIVCNHTKEGARDEFYAVVDNGGMLTDVSVEHPIYGRITAELSIASRYDADCFMDKTQGDDVLHLSSLTGGNHIHTVIAKDESTFVRICDKLSDLGILVDNT